MVQLNILQHLFVGSFSSVRETQTRLGKLWRTVKRPSSDYGGDDLKRPI